MTSTLGGSRIHGALGVAAGMALLFAGMPAEAAETVELKFDWGPALTVLRDIEPVAVGAPTASLPTDPMGGPALVSPSSGAVVTVPAPRRDSTAMRYRLEAKRQPDGAYQVRVIDFVMRVAVGDALIPLEPPMRRIVDTVAPAIALDARGGFAGLLEPDLATAMFKDIPRGFEERLKALPPETQAEARAQFEEMRSVEYVAARTALPWLESVGFWSGRRLEVGKVYTESAEERYLPMSSSRGPVRVERRWSAVGRVPCDEPAPAEAVDGKAGQSRGKPVSADCVRLSLRSTFMPMTPSVATTTEGRRDVRFESEVDLVTEPATLRPHRSQVTWRARSRNASDVEDARELQNYRMRWTYGEPALVALKSTLPATPSFNEPFVESANLKPKPVWAAGTPEQVFLDYRAAVDAGDWGTASGFLHPEFLARAAKRLRSKDGVRASDEMRRALVGEEVSLEQVDASSDAALMMLVSRKVAEAMQGPGPDRLFRMLGSKTVLGHVEDREGRIHLVIQDDEIRMPPEFRGDSSTVVMVRADQRFVPGASGEAPLPTCEPETDPLRCWRVWRHFSSEYDAITRAKNRLAARRVDPGEPVGPSVPGGAGPLGAPTLVPKP